MCIVRFLLKINNYITSPRLTFTINSIVWVYFILSQLETTHFVENHFDENKTEIIDHFVELG
jgi:hypothetical protein